MLEINHNLQISAQALSVDSTRSHHGALGCDVVVIGAGHNGLVAANYLADAGMKVIVVERSSQLGGMTKSEFAIPEAPRHLINHCAVDPIFWTQGEASKGLHLERQGLRYVKVDPAFVYLGLDGESIAFWKDPQKTADDIRRYSPHDGAAYLELTRLFTAAMDAVLPLFHANPTRPSPSALAASARAALRHRKLLPDLAAFLIGSAHDAISERFEHPVVRSALHVASGSVYPPSYPGSSIQTLLLAFVHRDDCNRPIGGTQAIPDALAARFNAAGGSILTDAEVTEIVVTKGRATGVILAGGREIQSAIAVLGSCDPKQMLTRMVTDGSLSAADRRRADAIPVNDTGWGQLKVDIACSGKVDLSRFEKGRTDGANLRVASHLIGTAEGVDHGYRRAAAGLLPHPEDISFYNAIPTEADPSQAPEGQDTLYLLNLASPAHPEGGWTPQLREKAVADTVDRAALFYGNMLELEIGRTSFTNEDLARDMGCEAASHVLYTIDRLGPLRPARGLGGYRTPIDGLYLGGSGSHPGPSVTGAPGLIGAREVLRDVKVRGEALRARVSSITRPRSRV